MSGKEEQSLKRIDIESKFPIGFHDLSKKEQKEIIKKLQDQDIEIRGEMKRKFLKSQMAEHDIAE